MYPSMGAVAQQLCDCEYLESMRSSRRASAPLGNPTVTRLEPLLGFVQIGCSRSLHPIGDVGTLAYLG